MSTVTDEVTLAAIHQRAKELANEAPAFTTEQAVLLRSMFARYRAVDEQARRAS